MNYRHSYHAGNFADVLKHVVLTRVITYLKRKPQAFRLIDTHAGAGRYDLSGTEAGKTGEWRDGIGRIWDVAAPDDVAQLIAPYLEVVRAVNGDDALRFYPGSPLIAQFLMRPSDRLIANELHDEDAGLLRAEFTRVRQAKVMAMDGYTAVKALLPPPERRGIVLIDPPFEEADEFERIVGALRDGLRRFAHGVFIIWYPVKNEAAVERFVASTQGLGSAPVLDVRLAVGKPFAGLGLTETGVMLFNPPYGLAQELKCILPWLVAHLSEDDGAHFEIRELGAAG